MTPRIRRRLFYSFVALCLCAYYWTITRAIDIALVKWSGYWP